MTVIGFTGYAQSGKDTAASFLAAHGFRQLAFADALRTSVAALNPIISVAREFVRPGWGRLDTILADYGYEETKRLYPEYRQLLQRMGTEVGRDVFGENFWVERVVNRIEKSRGSSHDFVITDVRFPNEEEAVHRLGGKVYRIVRPGTGAVNTHVSDTGIANLRVDGEIVNDGDLQTFEDRVLNTCLL